MRACRRCPRRRPCARCRRNRTSATRCWRSACEARDVLVEHAPDVRLMLTGSRIGQLVQRGQQRRGAREAELAIDELRQLPHRARAGLAPPLGEGAANSSWPSASSRVPKRAVSSSASEPLVPGIEHALLRELAHPFPVLAERSTPRSAAAAGRQVDVTAGDLDAGRHPLDVPLPRPGQRLVEIVRPEHQPAVRRGEPAEVRDVGVAARLHHQPRGRCLGQVGGHHSRRTAIERERRDQHPPIPDRHQLGQPRLGLNMERVHRVGPTRRRSPIPVARTRRRLARLPTSIGILAVLETGNPDRPARHGQHRRCSSTNCAPIYTSSPPAGVSLRTAPAAALTTRTRLNAKSQERIVNVAPTRP